MSETVTKRLHVSGLTPALTSSDISTRLSTFGTVKSLDGFGKLDGVGQPRKFGYVTLETTPQALKRCLTTLSGSTWKGARLRIGEAKPDYAERLQKERAAVAAEPPKKKRRIHHSKYNAILAGDMTLVTRENVSGRAGWKVMPSGRVVRSMRMRPERPLPPLPGKELKRAVGKKKMRIKEPDTRARRRKIDVTKWDGSYIRGEFLGSEEVARRIDERTTSVKRGEVEDEESEDEEDEGLDIEDTEGEETPEVVPEPTERQKSSPPTQISKPSASSRSNSNSAPAPLVSALSSDLQAEKTQTLSFLQSLFDSNSQKTAFGATADWDSDIDLEDVESRVIQRKSRADEDDDEFEVVPQDSQSIPTEKDVKEDAMDVDAPPAVSPPNQTQPDTESQHQLPAPPPAEPAKKSTLKDLFAPHEDEGGFSLLNHLDLELDEDVDIGIDFAPSAPDVSGPSQQDSAPIAAPVNLPSTSAAAATVSNKNSRSRAPVVLDPKKPLFFPRSISLAVGARAASSPFYEKPTEEQIQQRWEESKLELTRAWKKRWKEAGKMRRRKGGGGEEDGS
ncbi:hypothetical protein VKT23_003412 [Stygiomarasmius scandens]|uniref:RRM domain-containing protein n=1 Tax=Marasmiellus scandens TaxID=2682957 RepID=A0ABR1JXU0_9AGAR